MGARASSFFAMECRENWMTTRVARSGPSFAKANTMRTSTERAVGTLTLAFVIALLAGACGDASVPAPSSPEASEADTSDATGNAKQKSPSASATGSANTAQGAAPAAEQKKQGVAVDLGAATKGVIDTHCVDANGDGICDDACVDLDGDGLCDGVALDADCAADDTSCGCAAIDAGLDCEGGFCACLDEQNAITQIFLAQCESVDDAQQLFATMCR
jgi:hypothetical protein